MSLPYSLVGHKSVADHRRFLICALAEAMTLANPVPYLMVYQHLTVGVNRTRPVRYAQLPALTVDNDPIALTA